MCVLNILCSMNTTNYTLKRHLNEILLLNGFMFIYIVTPDHSLHLSFVMLWCVVVLYITRHISVVKIVEDDLKSVKWHDEFSKQKKQKWFMIFKFLWLDLVN